MVVQKQGQLQEQIRRLVLGEALITNGNKPVDSESDEEEEMAMGGSDDDDEFGFWNTDRLSEHDRNLSRGLAFIVALEQLMDDDAENGVLLAVVGVLVSAEGIDFVLKVLSELKDNFFFCLFFFCFCSYDFLLFGEEKSRRNIL